MSNISLRMVYDIRYKNIVHDCMWYKQNVPRRGRETPHLDTRELLMLRTDLIFRGFSPHNGAQP